MKLSPPLTVLAIAAAGLACTVWLKPETAAGQPDVRVSLPHATADKLALWAKNNPDPDGRSRSVAEVIEALVGRNVATHRSPRTGSKTQ